TLIAPGRTHELAKADRERLEELGVRTLAGPARGIALQSDCIVVGTAEGYHAFESVYPALGSDIHAELAGQIGVDLNRNDGCIKVDSHQRTSVPGVYAAGDVVIGLDQI